MLQHFSHVAVHSVTNTNHESDASDAPPRLAKNNGCNPHRLNAHDNVAFIYKYTNKHSFLFFHPFKKT